MAASGIKAFKKGNVQWIVFDNPRRKNAIPVEGYATILSALDEAVEDPEIFLVVFTGEGSFYSSGNDFSADQLTKIATDDPDYEQNYSRWVRRLIDHPKIIIGLINGPCIGIACTTLGLFDYVVCSSDAYFSTPFPSIGVCPEGVSSLTFPALLGRSKANEMLLFGEPLSAAAALQHGFVGRVFPAAEFRAKAEEMIARIAQLPPHSVLASKKLMRTDSIRNEMHTANRHEHTILHKLFNSEETVNLIFNKFNKGKAKM